MTPTPIPGKLPELPEAAQVILDRIQEVLTVEETEGKLSLTGKGYCLLYRIRTDLAALFSTLAASREGWISVGERLPERLEGKDYSRDVLVYGPHCRIHIGCAYFDWKESEKEYWAPKVYTPRLCNYGTHWREIPAPPEAQP